jgi:hypothetical protein
MDETRDHHIKQTKPGSKRHIPHFSLMRDLDKKIRHESRRGVFFGERGDIGGDEGDKRESLGGG